jgi:tetratricopeptide (TPR) repeat protein
MADSQPKSVFISYSHDSDDHKARVRALADRLRHEGIAAMLDQYVPNPSCGWPKWMLRQVEESDFILVVCTEPYKAKVQGRTKTGKGVKWESLLTLQDIYNNSSENGKVVPVVLSDDDVQHIFTPLDAFTHYDVGADHGYLALYRYLTGQPEIAVPPVGQALVLPPAAPPTTEPLRLPSSLHQLPAPPLDFTGRKKELDELRKSIATGNVAICGLKGMGGIGKTTLALTLAQELLPSYPDAQICLDLLGVTTPLSPSKAMAHVINSFDPNAKLPQEDPAVVALYRSVLFGKRVLLLMDNASDSAQVEPLVPPQGSFLFVTSRQHIDLPGISATDLNILPPRDAESLLLAITPRIGKNASALAEACGCLPLALRLAAGSLKKHPNVSVDSYLKRLSDAATRTTELAEPALAASYSILSAPLKMLWRQLAVFPSTFDSAAAAAVWKASAPTAESRLGDLVASSLVEWDSGGLRYHLHDLARDFAGTRLKNDPIEERAARKRHAAYFSGVLHSADNLYFKGGDSILQGIALYDLERANIDAGFSWACNDRDADEAAAICNSYCGTAHVLGLRQHPRNERIPWLLAAVAAAQKLGDQRAEGCHLGNLGLTHAALGETPEAIACYSEALDIAKKIDDRRHEGNALGNLGLAYAALGDALKAIEFHEKALLIDGEICDHRGKAADLCNLGIAWAALGYPRQAIAYYETALEIDRGIGNRKGEGADLGNLGLAHLDVGNALKAIECHEKQLTIVREIGDRRCEGTVLGNLGIAYAALGDDQKAIEHYEKALVTRREIGDRRGEGNALYNMAVALYNLGRRTKAVSHAEASLKIMKAIEDPHAPTVRAALDKWKSEP